MKLANFRGILKIHVLSHLVHKNLSYVCNLWKKLNSAKEILKVMIKRLKKKKKKLALQIDKLIVTEITVQKGVKLYNTIGCTYVNTYIEVFWQSN